MYKYNYFRAIKIYINFYIILQWYTTISVTPEKLEKYPDTVNKPDYIGLSEHSKNGLPVIYLAKKINGYSVATEIISEKRKILRPTSYYVYKTNSQEFKNFLKNNKMEEVLSVELDDIKSPNMYVQNDTPVTSSFNNIISSSKNYVNNTPVLEYCKFRLV